MTKQITKEEARKAFHSMDDRCNVWTKEHDRCFETLKQYIEQDNSQEEAKTLDEIEEEFWRTSNEFAEYCLADHFVDIRDLKDSIKQACKQYSASKDKEIESLRQTVSDLSQKLDMKGYEG